MKLNDLRVGDVYYALRNESLGYSSRLNIEGTSFIVTWLEKPGYLDYDSSGSYVFSIQEDNDSDSRVFIQEVVSDSYGDVTREDFYEVEPTPVEKVEYRRKK